MEFLLPSCRHLVSERREGGRGVSGERVKGNRCKGERVTRCMVFLTPIGEKGCEAGTK